MPAPDSAVFDRLRRLVALDDPEARPALDVETVFTGEPLSTMPIGTAEDVASAMRKARRAAAAWAATSPKHRAEIIDRYRVLVLRNRDALLDLAQAETGKSRAAALEDVLALLMQSRYFARIAPRLLKPRRVPGMMPGLTKTVVYQQPKGVVGVISPWNYPMALAIGDAIPALLAGNAVVLKPDSRTPYCALANAELLYEAGLPRELLAIVPGPGSVVGTAIVETCDYLMFTGSSATGRLLAQQCGSRLIGFSAELGGKNPMIVTAGANLDTVAKAAARACFANAGQLCLSIERIYVQDSVADSFTGKFLDAVAEIRLGAAYDFDTDMGSLISAAQLAEVSKHVEDARDKGATVLAGGRARPDLGPYFYEPTVLTGVTDDMLCARAETFGPVVSIYPVADAEAAIAAANDSEYGLNASVWAATPAAGQAIAARLHSGIVNVDEGYAPAIGSLAAPMGGMGSSGIGRRHGPQGLLKYTEPQTIALQRLLTLDPPPGLSNSRWQRLLAPVVNAIGALPRS
ncbi:succinic semialdehyde dehydrogenase [Nocardia inohanensis]|uniref:succinic semialdehyde dehydrogenase n=1 Tax=Nocardia inohanensis TaxID=209246 RepID=UPI0008348C47|nr:succinic semialdehyde dehydrogenase [Nocardia inohanensis]